MTSQFPILFSVLHYPQGLGKLQVCPFPDFVFPPLLLSALFSSPLHCVLQDGFGRTWWMGDLSIPMQFAPLYDGQVFMWLDCLLELVTWSLCEMCSMTHPSPNKLTNEQGPSTSQQTYCTLRPFNLFHGLAFTWWGCCRLGLWHQHHHKPTELAHSFLVCSCVCFGLYIPFNCISFQKFSRQFSAFSLYSSSLISSLMVLSAIYSSWKSPPALI